MTDSPEPMPIDVTQVDRDAAAAVLMQHCTMSAQQASWGGSDTSDYVQAFARHRLTAQPVALPLEATADMVNATLNLPDDTGGFGPSAASFWRTMARVASAQPVVRGEGGQDRKFAFANGQFVNRVSGEPIPLDEPIIIFRARDWHSLDVLAFYQGLANDPHHVCAIQDRINEFQAFRDEHPARMKEPGITRHIALNATPPAANDDALREVEKAAEMYIEWVASNAKFKGDDGRYAAKFARALKEAIAALSSGAQS